MGCAQTNGFGIAQVLLISTIVLQYQYQVFGIVFQYKTARLVLPCSPFKTASYAGNITPRHLQRVILFNTIELYMKERSTHAVNVTIRQLQRVISLNTSNLYMKKSIKFDTSKLFIKEQSTCKESDHQSFFKE